MAPGIALLFISVEPLFCLICSSQKQGLLKTFLLKFSLVKRLILVKLFWLEFFLYF